MTPQSIHRLDSAIIHRIAAGEIVDRPASVLKELLENSIDAGATHIKVNIVEGGLKRIEVEDDGFGMTYQDLEICLERHTTSKIKEISELDEIYTLGFRGEALSAISSVAKFKINTQRKGQDSWQLVSIGGAAKDITPSSHRLGTCVTVDDLFFNVPARKKFLKRESTESSECLDVLERQMLAHPEIHFEWYFMDTKGEIDESGDFEISSHEDRFIKWVEFSFLDKSEKINQNSLIHARATELPWGFEEANVYALKAPYMHRSQKGIVLTVNGRVVFDKRLPYALREAYAGLIETGHFPFVMIHLKLNPALVDVNVHPQKKEIRWPHDFSLASFIYKLIRPHLNWTSTHSHSIESENLRQSEITMYHSIQNTQTHSNQDKASESWMPKTSSPVSLSSGEGLEKTSESIPAFVSSRNEKGFEIQKEKAPTFRFDQIRVVGEVGAAWIVGEIPDGIIMIDQHAAHERVQFEKILNQKMKWTSAPLLIAYDLKIPMKIKSMKKELVSILKDLHFEVDEENSDDSKLSINAFPVMDKNLNWKVILKEVFEKLSNQEDTDSLKSILQYKMASSIACHGSIRRGQRISNEEIKQLLVELSQVKWGAFCPHGRPLWFLLSHEDIENTFHRS